MLILGREKNQVIRCTLPTGNFIDIMVVQIKGDQVKIGVAADKDVLVDRLEVFNAKVRDGVIR